MEVEGIVLSHSIATDEPGASCLLWISIVSIVIVICIVVIITVMMVIIIIGGETGCGSGEGD